MQVKEILEHLSIAKLQRIFPLKYDNYHAGK